MGASLKLVPCILTLGKYREVQILKKVQSDSIIIEVSSL